MELDEQSGNTVALVQKPVILQGGILIQHMDRADRVGGSENRQHGCLGPKTGNTVALVQKPAIPPRPWSRILF